MKTNKNKLSTKEQLQKEMMLIFEKHYKHALSESIKRGLKAKKEKLSTSKVAL